jgi:type IV pilus modification protein PilV
MSQQPSFIKKNARGFTLLEVLVSIGVLTIGLVGMASMVGATLVFGTSARYVNIANVLASEKLDSLNKWPSTDKNVAAGGSLAGPLNCAAGDTYCDQVTVSETSGADYTTQTQDVTDPVTGVTSKVATTIVHTSSGCVNTPAICGVPNPIGNGATFTRRWLITQNPVITSAAGAPLAVNGGRQITVLVSLANAGTKHPVTFQVSMVRP